ncbi:Assimilatory nitrate reductase large subunit [Marinobacterium lacunae]|uniref:Assimilatory nitrate reductase large subunit n=1 Tax=Marinobacterium lacunae TaxID=1232683 RepID=A0A081G179_9GAMM|nr:nitrate reductase [Marinobacterium lacunae]KEA64534.1 Assimilatory nitrate reductase large subunit [Marinobacterium lacunae]
MNDTTTCPYCGVGCGVKAQVQDQSIIAVSGDREHPANAGRLCVKGSALHETTSASNRLLSPRVAGVEVSWDTALDNVAERLQAIIDRDGPGAVAMYLSGQLLTEDYYVANKLMKGFIGSSHVDTNSRLCMSSTVAGYKRAFGGDLMPCSYDDIDHAELMILVGSNAAWNHPILYQRMVAAKRANPALRVVVLDPRRTATSDLADLQLSLKPGSDAQIFNLLLVELARRGQLNEAYISAHTEGFEAALSAAQESAPDIASVALDCDVSEQDLSSLVDWFCNTEKTLTFFSQGINQSSSGTDKVNAIINCHLATGRLGKPGMGPFSLTGQPNAMGGREVGGLANQLAAHMDFSSAASIERVERFWQAPNMARAEGYKAVDLFDAIERGEIKAVWIMATNPVVSLPDANRVRKALERCELVIVSECMSRTDTLDLAHIALPATTWGEKNGTVTNSERRISRQRGLISAPGEARHDWWAICEVAKRLGYTQAFDYRAPVEIFREHAALSGFENAGSRGFDISAMSTIGAQEYDHLKPIQWPITADAPQGTERLFSDGRFFTPSQRARFLTITPRQPAQQTDADYPLRLNTGRIRDQWHTMTRTGRAARLLQHRPEPFIEIHPQDAERFQLKDGALAELFNDLGHYRAPVVITTHQRPGELFIPMHWSRQFSGDAISGSLIASETDPVSGQPESKQGRAGLRAVDTRWRARLLVRQALELPVTYWTRVPLEHCTSYRLADTHTVDNWDNWCHRYLGEAPSMRLHDGHDGRYRACGLRDGKLNWLLLVERDDALPDLDWLDQQFAASTLDTDQRRQLLAATAPGNQPCGAVVCSCFQVREPEIRAAVLAGANSAERLGAQLKCGTNCGSCIPELKALISDTTEEVEHALE